ncbi:MAG: hypothetical protein A2X12_05050 [Bacteroidetes bacterium GWE2_29_8]|nr:MAG: hypothetical protein A2X12_05050 [Bacteroidetes bacterium GWE2_29_8]
MVRKLFSISLIAVILLTVSCAKMKDDTLPGGINNQSTATKSMENMGESITKDMGDLMTSPGTQGVMSLMSLMSGSEAFPMPTIPGLDGLLPLKKNVKRLTQSQLFVEKIKSAVTAEQLNKSPRGVAAMNSLFGKANAKNTKLYKKLIKANKAIKSGEGEEEARFEFDKNKGIYEFDKTKEEWTKVGSSDKIIMKFEFEDTLNNAKHKATLTVSEFSEKEFTVEGATQYLPTSIIIDLVVDGDVVASLDYSAEYFDNMMPKMINLDIFLTPFRFNANYMDKGEEISAGLSLTRDGQIIIGFGINIKFKDDNNLTNIISSIDTNQVDILNALVSIDGYIQYTTIKITASINVENIAKKGDNLKVSDLNDNVDIVMINTETNETIAELLFKESSEGENVLILVKFADGTEQAADEFFAGLAGGGSKEPGAEPDPGVDNGN